MIEKYPMHQLLVIQASFFKKVCWKNLDPSFLMVSLMRCANSRLFRADFCNAPAKRRWNLYENCTQWSGKCMQMLVQHIILKWIYNRYLHRGIEQSWCEIVCGPGSKHCNWRYFASVRAWSEIETAERKTWTFQPEFQLPRWEPQK